MSSFLFISKEFKIQGCMCEHMGPPLAPHNFIPAANCGIPLKISTIAPTDSVCCSVTVTPTDSAHRSVTLTPAHTFRRTMAPTGSGHTSVMLATADSGSWSRILRLQTLSIVLYGSYDFSRCDTLALADSVYCSIRKL